MRPEKFSRNRKHTHIHVHKGFLFFDGFFGCLTIKTLFLKRKFQPIPLDEKKYFLLFRKKFLFSKLPYKNLLYLTLFCIDSESIYTSKF